MSDSALAEIKSESPNIYEKHLDVTGSEYPENQMENNVVEWFSGSHENSEQDYQGVAEKIHRHQDETLCEDEDCLLTTHDAWHAEKISYGEFRTSSWGRVCCRYCNSEVVYSHEGGYKKTQELDDAQDFINNVYDMLHDSEKTNSDKISQLKKLVSSGQTSWQQLKEKSLSSTVPVPSEVDTPEDIEMRPAKRRPESPLTLDIEFDPKKSKGEDN